MGVYVAYRLATFFESLDMHCGHTPCPPAPQRCNLTVRGFCGFSGSIGLTELIIFHKQNSPKAIVGTRVFHGPGANLGTRPSDRQAGSTVPATWSTPPRRPGKPFCIMSRPARDDGGGVGASSRRTGGRSRSRKTENGNKMAARLVSRAEFWREVICVTSPIFLGRIQPTLTKLRNRSLGARIFPDEKKCSIWGCFGSVT